MEGCSDRSAVGKSARASMHVSINTVLPADSVEFCPHPDASNLFVCGTYKLQDERNPQPSDSTSTTSGSAGQIRTGQCLVFEVDSEQDIRACATRAFIISTRPGLKGGRCRLEIQEITLPAVLDMRW
jgi:diphthine methyl ester acylhydrolase